MRRYYAFFRRLTIQNARSSAIKRKSAGFIPVRGSSSISFFSPFVPVRVFSDPVFVVTMTAFGFAGALRMGVDLLRVLDVENS